MRYANIPVQDYLDELASKSPVPGGGSAATLFGAISCALMEMVLNYSSTKNISIIRAKRVFKSQRTNFVNLIDKDIAAYKRYSSYKTQNNLKGSTAVPLEVCIRSYEMANYCNKLISIVNKNLISDLGCAVHGFASSFKTAKLNVYINIKYIKDDGYVQTTKKKINLLNRKINSLEKNIIKHINKIINKPWQKY